MASPRSFGYTAYRYNAKYYCQRIRSNSSPKDRGREIMGLIPRNPAALEKWIEKLSKVLPNQKARREFFGLDDDSIYTDPEWTLQCPDSLAVVWTYVIDLDNRVFTVNGVVHFKLDNLVPLRASGSKLGFADYYNYWRHPLPEIPAEHLASVDLWTKLNFNAEKAQQEYTTLQPTVKALEEWNAPTWDALSVSQYLGVSLIKTLVHDYPHDLSLCYYPFTWPKLAVFNWSIANAAATSCLHCPPVDLLPPSNTIYVFNTGCPEFDTLRFRGPERTSLYYLEHRTTVGRCYWFRGCLIAFCVRLDEPAYMTHKVVQMVRRLREKDRTQGIGIIMSPWHLVAVTVDGPNVCHSPVLELHDGKEPKDGALLLMHLLSPTFTRSKASWLVPVHLRPYNNHPIVPDEILHQIIHFTGFDTYTRLPMVSRHFRSICLTYPRIGDHILLGHKGAPPSLEPRFKVRSTHSAGSQLAILGRVETFMPFFKSLPRQFYYTKYDEPTPEWDAGFSGMFQCYKAGVDPSSVLTDKNKASMDRPGIELKPKSFRDIIGSKSAIDMRVQVLDGIWKMMV